MNLLTYQSETPRRESDPNIIARLVSKGWTDTGPEVPTPLTSIQLAANRVSAIRIAAKGLVDAQVGSDPTRILHMLMRGLNRVRKETHGRANPADVAELDQLETIANYVEQIRDEEDRLLADDALNIDDAMWPTI